MGLIAGGATSLALSAAPAARDTPDHRKRPPRRHGRRPNFLFMLVDEMRYPPVYETEVLRQFRRDYLQTQNALRATGVEFHRHYTASTACSPSRASIFTGHYPSLHGVTQTTGVAKSAHDPDVFWLDPNSVPTLGDYFRAAGYRTFYRGKWHVSEADLAVPGSHEALASYTQTGGRDSLREKLYEDADRLAGYGFDGWIGPEPHGSAPLNTGSSPSDGRLGRDQAFASQSVELLKRLDSASDHPPWFLVTSFVNPHDIALWGFAARSLGVFDFTVDSTIPSLGGLFDATQFARTLLDDLSQKPHCQESYRATYDDWMQGVPPPDYFRLYYQLHKNVDAEMFKVYMALQRMRSARDTIIVFTSDHGDLLGSHRYMHQKWHQAYDEALRVPLIVSGASLPQGRAVHSITSHVDLLPTMLGLAGYEAAELMDAVAVGHTDAVPPVGRNLAPLINGDEVVAADPVFFMSDDEPSRGLNQENIFGVAYDSIPQPNHIESVIVELDGEVWKFSRYFDNSQFWSDPERKLGGPRDVILKVEEGPIDVPGEHPVNATKRVKFQAAEEEFEMYNVTRDPMELDNLAYDFRYLPQRRRLAQLLDQQRAEKRLRPISGDVPGQP